MGKYIDTKWLEDNAKEYSLGYYDYDEYAVPLSALDSAPSIDIVRCKDCIVFGTHGKNTDICPMWHNTHIDPYRDFCSRGVRKTENSSEKPNNLSDIPTGSGRSGE